MTPQDAETIKKRLWWRTGLILAAWLHLTVGLSLSTALGAMVPATNIYGRAYLTALWPVWIAQKPLGFRLDVPAWCFTFKEQAQ